ncbi:unnamed protein product [Lactuca virosa]|uniref:Uncharacterized protein n=1 Tax=Lactuca virosa TaxID=75947 RepID=A0AAU9LYX2_9ASTR|nr:unnamed protein product [Lactuca virosa]
MTPELKSTKQPLHLKRSDIGVCLILLGKYDVPDDANSWVLRTIGNSYKFYGIKKDVAKRCSRAKEIRRSLKNMHKACPKSFARICDEMEQMKKYEHREDESDVVDPYMIMMKKE